MAFYFKPLIQELSQIDQWQDVIDESSPAFNLLRCYAELLRIEESMERLECEELPSRIWAGNVTFKSDVSGWHLIIFNDCGGWDLIDDMIDPEGMSMTSILGWSYLGSNGTIYIPSDEVLNFCYRWKEL